MDTLTATTFPRVTLCVIAGNEAHHIERMLRSFAPIFDCLSLVIATGNQEPDDTAEIAARVCDDLGKAHKVSSYDNQPAARNWPHVDDFAAARNAAFEQADCDWLFWADCDDVLAGDPAAFRALTEGSARTAYSFPYEVPAAGKVAIRERFISRETWNDGARWVGAVHENLAMPEGTKRETSHACRWVHQPLGDKTKDGRRNLRILTRAVAESPTSFFYIAQEYAVAKNRANLKRFGDIFLAMPGGEKSMRYQMHLYLADIAETHEERAHHALAAYWIFPLREALAALTRFAMEEDDAGKARHWSELLVNTPLPSSTEWFHEPRWYGWAGEDLHVRAIRMGGDHSEAVARAATYRIMARQRNERTTTVAYVLLDNDVASAMRLRERWLSLAVRPRCVEWVFVLPADSPARKWLRGFVCAEKAPKRARQIDGSETPQEGWDNK